MDQPTFFLFLRWMVDILKDKPSATSKLILFVDNHSSRFNPTMLKWAYDHHIILWAFPPTPLLSFSQPINAPLEFSRSRFAAANRSPSPEHACLFFVEQTRTNREELIWLGKNWPVTKFNVIALHTPGIIASAQSLLCWPDWQRFHSKPFCFFCSLFDTH